MVAAFAYSGFLLYLTPGDVDVTTVVSTLESSGRFAKALRALDVVSAALTLPLIPFVHRALPPNRWRPVAVWSLVVFAVAGIPAGAIPLPHCVEGEPGCTQTTAEEIQGLLHDGLSIVSTVGLIVCAAACALALRETGPRWLTRAASITVAVQVVTGAVLGLTQLTGPEAVGGVFQRVEILGISAWIVCLAVFAATEGIRAAPTRGRAGPRRAPPRGAPP